MPTRSSPKTTEGDDGLLVFASVTSAVREEGWTADAHATAQTALYNFDVARFYEKWFRDMRDGQADHGEVPTIVPTTGYSVYPHPGWDSVEDPVPAWDAAYFIMPWLMYRHKGDERILSQQYGLMKVLGMTGEWFYGSSRTSESPPSPRSNTP